ncbi:MAG TPA: 3-hydroxyacyl-CoA dehydrogenase [Rhodospirillales bacterium]|jgi:3-hydroxyacyl-CoA dehydrogenase|nr:3-hydroxyacyl-CoA dehydrogenase [Rhodospirillales bacterium]
MDKIAIVGAGFIGCSWSIVFGRAGHPVTLYDSNDDQRQSALDRIGQSLEQLAGAGLIKDAGDILSRIRVTGDLAEAVSGAVHVQEAVTERLEAKKEAFRAIDERTSSDAIIASSSSTLPPSSYSEGLFGRSRCLLAHPLNPPHLVPAVEVLPAPWTAEDAVAKTRALMESVGQAPIVMKKEIAGFIVNRLQVALLNEAFALLEDDCISAADLDTAITEGLGLRWSVVGPFETIDLNASGGLSHYVEIFADLYHEMMKDRGAPRRWDPALVERINGEMRARWSLEEVPQRQTRRDSGLMALARLQNETAAE